MNTNTNSSRLDKPTIEYIKSLARQKHVEYRKLNDVISTQIFNILELNSKVLYYPLEDNDVWGFCDTISGQTFVCINTSISYDKQVFAAAHELYHLWFDKENEVLLSSALEEIEGQDTISLNELKANRFAAEFLVEENLLRQEMTLYSLNKDSLDIDNILKLADIFLVPYKTMVKRLREIEIINDNKYVKLISYPKSEIEIWRKRLGLRLPDVDNFIKLDNLINRAMELYEQKLITLDKLEYILSFAKLTPDQLGVEQPPKFIPPTDIELQAILEE